MIADEILFDPTHDTKTMCVRGAFAAHPHQGVTRRQVTEAIPLIDHDDFADSLKTIAKQKYAYVDRAGNKWGKPIRLRTNQNQVDTFRPGTKAVHVPVAALKKINARSAEDIRYLALCCLEQKRRRGIQLPDTVAARQLGWIPRRATRARERLIAAGTLREVKPARGKHVPAVYEIADALPDAPSDFDPDSPDRFDETRTRYDRRIALGDGAALTVYANEAEERLLEMRVDEASEETLGRVRELAAEPDAACEILDANRLLDGPLGITPNDAQKTLHRTGFGRSTGRGSDAPPDRNYLSRTSLSSPIAASGREEEEEEKARAEGGEDVTAATAARAESDRAKIKSGFDEEKANQALPAAVALRLAELFGENAKGDKHSVGKVAHFEMHVLARKHGGLNPTQRQLVTDAVLAQLAPIEKNNYRRAIAGLRYVSRSDEELHEALKAAAGEHAPAAEDRLIDISAELAELVNARP